MDSTGLPLGLTCLQTQHPEEIHNLRLFPRAKLDTYRGGPGPTLDCPCAGWYGGRWGSGSRCLDSKCRVCHWGRVRSALQGSSVSWWVRDVCVSSCTHVGSWFFLSFPFCSSFRPRFALLPTHM